MRYEVVLAPEALDDFRALRANAWAEVRDALEAHLRFQPTKATRSRIKRLRGLSRPQCRLRVGDVRVHFDIEGSEVHVVAIVGEGQAAEWLRKVGR